jgi:hypothetical protein
MSYVEDVPEVVVLDDAGTDEKADAEHSQDNIVVSVDGDDGSSSSLESDYMLVVCDYLPKIYVSSLFLIGACVFAFMYLLLKSFFKNFV